MNDADAFFPGLLGHGLSVSGFFGINDQAQHDFDSDATLYVGVRPTVVGGTVYKGNREDVTGIGLGDSAIDLEDDDPLFVDAQNGNYFLADSSQAIDSSISFLGERASLNQLLSFLEIESEGITAPTLDALGVTRVDDPRVEPPDGVGDNVFIDRGALERADFVGPTGALTSPLDNDAQGLDTDPAENSVAAIGRNLTSFRIRLNDGASLSDPVFGSGIDDSSVTSSAVILRQDGVELQDGTDYVFTYDATNDTIRLVPVAGVWPSNAVYEVTLLNTPGTDENGAELPYIRDRADNPLQPNRVTSAGGVTTFLIATGQGSDYGDAPANYPTARADDGARHLFSEGVFLGSAITTEVDAATTDVGDDGVVFTSNPLLAGAPMRVTVSASVAGLLNAWVDFNDNQQWDANEQIFSDEMLVAGDNNLVATVPNSAAVDAEVYARFRFSTQAGLQPTGEASDGEVEDYAITIAKNEWQNENPGLAEDVNGDGEIGPVDALRVINVLTFIANGTTVVGVDGVTGGLENPRPDGSGTDFLDVNSDGFVSPLDALLVINALPSTSGSAAVQAPLSGGDSIAAFRAPVTDDEEESLDSTIDEIALDVAQVWEAE